MSTVLPDDGGWEIAGAVMGHVQNVLLFGPSGTGKSFFAKRNGINSFYSIHCHDEMSEADILGGPALYADNGGTRSDWCDGSGIRAWREGKRLVIDEIDKSSGPALTALLCLLDDMGVASYTIPTTGEHVLPAKGFHVVATMNGEPDDLPDALKDRFTVRIEIDRPHPDAIKSLPKDLQRAAHESARLDGHRRVSIRGWKAFASLRDSMSWELAAAAVFGARGTEILDSFKIAKLVEKAPVKAPAKPRAKAATT